MNFNQLYEREVPFMSKAASPKDGKMHGILSRYSRSPFDCEER